MPNDTAADFVAMADKESMIINDKGEYGSSNRAGHLRPAANLLMYDGDTSNRDFIHR